MMKRSQIPLKAEWDVGTDANNQLCIILRLSDSFGAATATFSSKEMSDWTENPNHLKNRLHWLWGDLLQSRSHEQLKQLELIGTEQGE